MEKSNIPQKVRFITLDKRTKTPRMAEVPLNILAQQWPSMVTNVIATGQNEFDYSNDNGVAMTQFVAWLLTGNFKFDCGGGDGHPADGSDNAPEDEGDILFSVLQYYLLAMRFRAFGFADAVIKQACETFPTKGGLLRDDMVNAIYDSTSTHTFQGGYLRKWIVDEWVWNYDHEGYEDLEWNIHRIMTPEFLFDVMKVQARRLGKDAEVCRHAVHSDRGCELITVLIRNTVPRSRWSSSISSPRARVLHRHKREARRARRSPLLRKAWEHTLRAYLFPKEFELRICPSTLNCAFP
jgi:hypothetical protein